MARMRYSAPLPPRGATPLPAKPQRYAIGTRVANPLEGRTGHIDAYNSERGVYRLIFNDGHVEDVADADVDRFVIRRPAVETPVVEETSTAMDTDDVDPFHLINSAVTKTFTSYNGQTKIAHGVVVSYFPDVQRYRVVFESGVCEDWHEDDAKRIVTETVLATANKRKANTDDEEQKGQEDDEEQRRKKKQKTNDNEPPLIGQKFPSRQAAFGIIVKALRGILQQATVKKFRTERQMQILSNKDIPPRRALQNFVEADGLKFLQKVLMHWMSKTEYHLGAMLVLKIIGALPGVTADAVVESLMGRTLRVISRASRDTKIVDAALGDLADWIISTWQREHVSRGASTTTNKPQVLAATGAIPPLEISTTPRVRELSAKTKQLHALLAAREPEPIEPTTEAEELAAIGVYMPEYNKLGSIDKRRPGRQIIHIESLVERANKKTEDSSTTTEGETTTMDYEVVGQMQFGKNDILLYSQFVPTAKMMATARSKIFARQRSGSNAEEEPTSSTTESAQTNDTEEIAVPLPPPNKLQAPTKSILKVREEDVFVPLNKIVWK